MKTSIKALAKEARQRIRTAGVPENKSTLPCITQEEERVWQIVCRLCAADEIVTNPIMQVADPSVWRQLEGSNRERYVLNLSAVYLRQLERWQQQRAQSN